MYVTLYDGNVHPGVNMLLGMGKLVGSNDREAVAEAGKEIQDWAQGASDRIVHLISEVSFFGIHVMRVGDDASDIADARKRTGYPEPHERAGEIARRDITAVVRLVEDRGDRARR